MVFRFAGVKVGVILVVMSMLCGGGEAQSCTTALTSLFPCLNYINGNSSTPSSSCCSQLKSVLQSSPQCLCSAVNGGAPLGFAINRTLALQLPSACKMQTPPVSQCNNAPTPTPNPNPAAAPPPPTPNPNPAAAAPPPPTPNPNPAAASPTPTPNPNPAAASPTPVGSPSDSSDGSISPSPSDIPSGTGSKSVPSTDGGSSNSNILKSSIHLIMFLLCVATIAKF